MPAQRSVRRSRPTAGGRYGRLAYNLGRFAGSAYRSFRRNRTPRSTLKKIGRAYRQSISARKTGTVTQQKDVVTTGPPRSKPRNTRFARQVDMATARKAGVDTILFNGGVFTHVNVPGEQAHQSFPLFGAFGSVGMNSDLEKILGLNENITDPISPHEKNLYIHYGILELSIRALSENTTPAIVDIYEWKYKMSGRTSANSLDTVINSEIAEEDLMADIDLGAVTSVALTDFNATPYQLPNVCRTVTFGKKTTIMLQPGQGTRYKFARKKARWLSGDAVIHHVNSFAMPGWTEGILLVSKGLPGSSSTATAASLNLAQTRTYSFMANNPKAKNAYANMNW